MSRLLGTRAGVKSVRFWQLSSCWFVFRWWLFLRVFPLWAQLEEREVGWGGVGWGVGPPGVGPPQTHKRLQRLGRGTFICRH